MKYKVAIEETVVGEFEVEADSPGEALELAEERYRKGQYVLEPGEVQFRQMSIVGPESEATEWKEF